MSRVVQVEWPGLKQEISALRKVLKVKIHLLVLILVGESFLSFLVILPT